MLSYAYTAGLVAHKVANSYIPLHFFLSGTSTMTSGSGQQKTLHDGISYVQHRKMCILWKGQETVFKVLKFVQ
jgi:uncharacterized cupin superfamily protein